MTLLRSTAPGTGGAPDTAVIRVAGITKHYSRGRITIPVLQGVTLDVARGEMVALMGASGSGKTTLVNLIGSLDRPTAGRYWLDGDEVSGLLEDERADLRGRKIGFVFQDFNLIPRLSALENVALPLEYAFERLGASERRARARALLERVGLGDRLDHEPSQLSGGEQQRVAIARALVNRCSVLIADEPTGNLDSKTGEDILALFRQLGTGGELTIFLVTHDPTVAAHANRIIRIRDGVLVDDSGPGAPAIAPAPAPGPPPRRPRRRRRRPGRGPGFFLRTAAMALRSLRCSPLRSALTTLGIIIGVASMIAITEVGKGSWTAIREMLKKTGVDNILIQPGAASRNGVSLGSGSIKTLVPEDADAILRECPSVDSVAPLVSTRQQVVHQGRNWNPASVFGTTPGFLRVREWEDLEEGEPFTDEDVRDGAQVCLLGLTLVRELFGERSPIGEEVLVKDVPLKVIGVLRKKGADIIGEDQDDILLAPWTTIKFRVSSGQDTSSSTAAAAGGGMPSVADQIQLLSRRYPRSGNDLFPTAGLLQLLNTPKLERMANVDMILVRSVSTAEIPAAMAQITELLRPRHKIPSDQADDFSVRDFTEVIEAVRSTVKLISELLLCVALIALVVGGVGIMNIMLVSVTERYREIGLRMAVGARPRDILLQFLVESVVLCLMGGAAGILVGRGTSVLVRHLAGWPTQPSWTAVIASVAVSATVGIAFGYYPAWKASRLNPIEALAYE